MIQLYVQQPDFEVRQEENCLPRDPGIGQTDQIVVPHLNASFVTVSNFCRVNYLRTGAAAKGILQTRINKSDIKVCSSWSSGDVIIKLSCIGFLL